MNPVATQQVVPDNSFVAPEKRVKIEKCNARIAFKEELVTFIQELGYSRKCDMLSAIHTDQMHQPWRTFATIINRKSTPKKARNYKKVSSPSRKLSPVLEEEPTVKPKKAKKLAKKSTTVPTIGVVIKDTPGVFVSKKKAPTKFDRGKGMDLLSDASLLEAVQLKEALKKSKKDSHMLYPSGSGDGVGSQLKVPNEFKDKTTGTYEGTGTKPGVPNVPKYQYENSERTDSDEKVNHNLNLEVNEEEEIQKDEYIHTPDYYVPTDEETNDENKEFDDEEYDEYYKDVNVRSKVTEHEEVGKRDAEMTDATHESASQENSYEQVIKDAHVTLTYLQKTEGLKQSSSVSSDFANKFLNLDNVPPVIDEVASMMNVKVCHEDSSTQVPLILLIPVTAILKTSIVPATTVYPSIQPFTPIPQQSTSTLVPITAPTTTLVPILASIKSQIPAIVDEHLTTRIEFATQTALQSYTTEFKKKAQEEKDRYIDLIEKSIKDIIKDKVKKFELKKILLDKIQKSKSYRGAPEHRQLYDALIKSYKLDKDLFASCGNKYSLKRDYDDKDQDEDPPAVSDQGLKKQKTSKDVEPLKGSKSKDSTSSSSKGTTSQPKSSGKSLQVEEPVFEVTDTEIIAQTEKPSITFDELMSTPIDFSAYVMNNLKIDNLTQEILVGPAFNLFNGTCKSFVELEYNFEECYKAVTDQIDWNNPEGHAYPFDLSKPLPLIKAQGCQVVPANYFFNNDFEYLKGRSLSRKYMTSTTKTKVAKYDNIEGIKDMVPML
uniref:Uncharacterized protein n=1 Tax=Tanacetum cinerariifolium TaxID=118510 RepID=A0A6L2NH17_TANCI|nr:hypothetical protein [Tanacetum cinerariifolium]